MATFDPAIMIHRRRGAIRKKRRPAAMRSRSRLALLVGAPLAFTIKIKRGPLSRMPTLQDGELALDIASASAGVADVYVGLAGTNYKIKGSGSPSITINNGPGISGGGTGSTFTLSAQECVERSFFRV